MRAAARGARRVSGQGVGGGRKLFGDPLQDRTAPQIFARASFRGRGGVAAQAARQPRYAESELFLLVLSSRPAKNRAKESPRAAALRARGRTSLGSAGVCTPLSCQHCRGRALLGAAASLHGAGVQGVERFHSLPLPLPLPLPLRRTHARQVVLSCRPAWRRDSLAVLPRATPCGIGCQWADGGPCAGRCLWWYGGGTVPLPVQPCWLQWWCTMHHFLGAGWWRLRHARGPARRCAAGRRQRGGR